MLQGPHQYCHLPLGLKESEAVCEQLVQEALTDPDGVVSHVNDILIFAPTIEAHDNLVKQVL